MRSCLVCYWPIMIEKLLFHHILALGLKFIGSLFFVPQLSLLIWCRDHLAYLGVEALAYHPPGGAGTGTTNYFFIYSILLYFSAILLLHCSSQCSSFLFALLYLVSLLFILLFMWSNGESFCFSTIFPLSPPDSLFFIAYYLMI